MPNIPSKNIANRREHSWKNRNKISTQEHLHINTGTFIFLTRQIHQQNISNTPQATKFSAQAAVHCHFQHIWAATPQQDDQQEPISLPNQPRHHISPKGASLSLLLQPTRQSLSALPRWLRAHRSRIPTYLIQLKVVLCHLCQWTLPGIATAYRIWVSWEHWSRGCAN